MSVWRRRIACVGGAACGGPPPIPSPPTQLSHTTQNPNNPNTNRCGNVAAVLAFDEHLNREFKMFKEVPESEFGQNPERRNLVPYFL